MTTENTGEQYEETYVHQVYDEIASHFSSTRFKPWPVVDSFLKDLPSYAIGLDIGCGNGKYLTVRKDLFIVASDRSPELLKFAARHQPHSAVVGDVLNLPHPKNTFDFAICIAVIHHLSTPQRRRDALREILSTLRPLSHPDVNKHSHGHEHQTLSKPTPGQALVFVWALEQKTSRRGWDSGMNQDVLVPWVLKNQHDRTRNTAVDSPEPGSTLTSTVPSASGKAPDTNSEVDTSCAHSNERTLNRYYHLYREGELQEDIAAAGGKVVRHGYDRDNWWAICERS